MSTSSAKTLIPRFPFPKKAINRPIVPPVSLPVAVRRDPINHRVEPWLPHAGVKYLQSSWSKGKFKGGRKFEILSRRRRRDLEQQSLSTDFVAPVDRIRLWNIGPGDRVRILRGEDEDKYVDQKLGKKGGWKIYTVERIDQKNSRVYFFKTSDKRPEPERRPHNWIEMSQEQRIMWLSKRDAARERKQRDVMRDSYHYSDLGLLMMKGDTPREHVWAKRVRCTAPKWSEEHLAWTWDRYGVYRDPITRLRRVAKINWPLKQDKSEDNKAGDTETKLEEAERITLDVKAGRELLEQNAFIERLIPQTLRSPPPPPTAENLQWASDIYLLNKQPSPEASRANELFDSNDSGDMNQFVDLLMPLYLGEELSPRFSSWKKDLAFQHRQALFAEQKADFIQRAVDEWEAGGKDRHLREIMDTPQALLSGVPVTARTKKEVIEAAELEYKSVLAQDLKDTTKQLKKGKQWDYENQVWLDTAKSKGKERKARRKREKYAEKLRELDQLKLKESKNQILPPGLSLNAEAATVRVRATV